MRKELTPTFFTPLWVALWSCWPSTSIFTYYPPPPLGDAIPRPKGDASICSLGEHLVERKDSQVEGGGAEQEQQSQQAQQASTEEDPTQQQGQEKEDHDDDAGVSFNVGAATSEIGQEVKEDAEGIYFLTTPLSIFVLTCTCGGIYPWRVEPA